MGKSQWANHTKKKMTRNSDAPKLDYIQNNISLRVTGREKIYHNKKFTTRNNCHEADLVLNDTIILHHDTVKIHGELSVPDKKTLKRDMDFERAGYSYFIINQDLAKHLALDEADLSEYLYYHTLHKLKVREELSIAV